MYITNKPDVALLCQQAGVERIFVDMEWKGKAVRQGHLNSVKSMHSVEDVARIRPLLDCAELLVRVNPVDNDTPQEVDAVIAAGADVLMLPMARNAEEVEAFVKAVRGRARTVLLLETRGAENSLDDILKAGGIDEVHIGLNDLSLDYGIPFMFTLLANGTVERICQRIKAVGIPYGFGGVAQIGGGKVPAEYVLMEHIRLGSTRAILSRSFYNASTIQDIDVARTSFSVELARIRDAEKCYRSASAEEFQNNIRRIKELCL